MKMLYEFQSLFQLLKHSTFIQWIWVILYEAVYDDDNYHPQKYPLANRRMTMKINDNEENSLYR